MFKRSATATIEARKVHEEAIMSDYTAEETGRDRRARWNVASSTWFLLIVGAWIAFGVAAASSPDTLTDFWHWGQRLSLAAEVGLWIGTLPWMLAIAVLETSWAGWLQITLIAALAVSWVVVSVPQATGDRRSSHGELRPGEPREGALTQKGLRPAS
jgi:hypothetical protein